MSEHSSEIEAPSREAPVDIGTIEYRFEEVWHPQTGTRPIWVAEFCVLAKT